MKITGPYPADIIEDFPYELNYQAIPISDPPPPPITELTACYLCGKGELTRVGICDLCIKRLHSGRWFHSQAILDYEHKRKGLLPLLKQLRNNLEVPLPSTSPDFNRS